jgi:hypothetical protein
MVKKAALSLRISESTKKALDNEAIKEQRSTASLVQIILRDFLQAQLSGGRRKYPGGKRTTRRWRTASGYAHAERKTPWRMHGRRDESDQASI